MSLTTQLLADAVDKGGPGSGPHPGDKMGLPVGARAIRNPKTPGWRDGKDSRGNDQTGNNHGVILAHVTGFDNKDRPMHGFRFRSDNDAKILKDPKSDKWDKASATKGTFYGITELVPEKGKK